MNNNLNFQFGMYEHATDSIIVNTGKNSILIIRCKECNSSVTFDDPNDVVSATNISQKSPTRVEGPGRTLSLGKT